MTTNHLRWGVTDTYSSQLVEGSHYEPGYVQGGDGGSINITAPAMALDGDFRGLTYSGPHQRVLPPAASSLSLVFEAEDITDPNFLPFSPTPPNIVFRADETLAAVDPFALDGNGHPLALREDRQSNVILSPELMGANGFGSLRVINSDGNITVPENVVLNAPAYGSITLTGANLDIEGRIRTPGGSIRSDSL